MAMVDARDKKRRRLDAPPAEPCRPPPRWRRDPKCDAVWEAAITARAIMDRWDVKPAQRRKAIKRLVDILSDPNADYRAITTATMTLIRADAQNLAWAEHELKKAQQQGGSQAVADALELLKEEQGTE